MARTVLESKNIVKYYQDGDDRLDILRGVSLAINEGEMVVITGASGSGKSTLLHTLGLLDVPNSGEVIVDGQLTNNFSENQRSQIRNEKLGFVYQFHHLLPEFNALENVMVPLIVRRQSHKLVKAKAIEVLEKVGLSQRILHYPGQLSGGERQRVALARALVASPVCLLADEPTGNLDNETASKMYDLLRDVSSLFDTAFVIVTHDTNLASLADRRFGMHLGLLEEL